MSHKSSRESVISNTLDRLPNLSMPNWESESVKMTSKITVICSIHNSWSRPTLKSLKNGSLGCTKCIHAALSEKAKDNYSRTQVNAS